ncbi:MAG: hypothetical protein PHY98_05725 [Candidatus Cloacimonetes bacterium]|nr:hypothetical protein [Candidatus Cloacimonadota bacterium]
MKTLLVFADESFNEDRSYSQISGFLITPSNYIKLRKDILIDYSERYKRVKGNDPMVYQPCYHSSRFCPELNDEDKLTVWNLLLKKVYSYSTIVFVHGVHSAKSFSDVVPMGKQGHLDITWFCHLRYLNSYARNNYIIPIVDLGLNKSFASLYRMYSQSHNSIMGAAVCGCGIEGQTDYFGNILEPVFCKDEYSIGVQLADLIGAFRWTNSMLYPNVAESCFKSSAVIMFNKYIKRRKTNCLFYEIGYDQENQYSHIRFHDSFIAGKPIINDMSE